MATLSTPLFLLFFALSLSLMTASQAFENNNLAFINLFNENTNWSLVFAPILILASSYVLSSIIAKLWNQGSKVDNSSLFIFLIIFYALLSEPTNFFNNYIFSDIRNQSITDFLNFSITISCCFFLILSISQAISSIFSSEKNSISLSLLYKIAFLLVTFLVLSLVLKNLDISLTKILTKIFLF